MMYWERTAGQKCTHTNSSFLLEQWFLSVAFSCPNLPLLTFPSPLSPLPQQIAKTLEHTYPYTHNLHFPTHSFHFCWLSSAARSVGPPNLLGSLSALQPQLEVPLSWLLPAPRTPALSLWAVDSSSLFKFHLKSVPLGFPLRSALDAKSFGRLCIKGVIGTNGTHKSIALNLHDFG